MKETDYDAHLGLENSVGKPIPQYKQREEIERELDTWKAGIDAILQVLFYLGLFSALMFSLGYFWYRSAP